MSSPPVLVRDRATGGTFEERVFGGNALHFLYGTRRGRALTNGVLVRKLAHRIYGWLKARPQSRAEIPEFVRSLGIDATEATLPLDAYTSLDAFFARELRPGARPFEADPASLPSPAEGRTLVLPRVDGPLVVKASRVALDVLLGSAELARAYRGGAAVVVRLAPADYHRFHFPAGGVASAARPIDGVLHSVHPIALGAGAPSFRNKRAVTLLETEGFGRLAQVEVGALCVGTIEQTYVPGPVKRGDEKGLFHFGGSTVVLLAEPGRIAFDDDLVAASAEGQETMVRLGTRIARRLD